MRIRDLLITHQQRVYLNLEEIASKYDLLIVEDGAYNYLVYEPVEVKSLKSMDSEERVIFVCSLSKVLGTGYNYLNS